MSKDKDLTVVIESRTPGARSLLPEVIDQLESLVRFLKSLTDDDVTFEVISLSKNSPMTVKLRPLSRVKVQRRRGETKKPYAYRRSGVATDRAQKTFSALAAHKRLPSYADPYALVQLREFADDLRRTDHYARITANDQSYTIDETLRGQIDSSLGNARIAYTSFTGELSRLNVHGSRWSFTIFPVAGPNRILCYFNKELLDVVRALVKEVVTVTGRATYQGDSPWPVSFRIDRVCRRIPAREGLWLELPDQMANDWEQATDEDRDLIREEKRA